MYSVLRIALPALLLAPLLLAQSQRQETLLRYGERSYLEILPTLSDSADMARVDVLLRVAYDFMIFERDASAHPDSAFKAGVDVSVNLSRAGVSIGSYNIGARVATAAYTETERRDQYALLQRTLYLEQGDYSALVVLTDRGSRREQRFERTFRAFAFSDDVIGLPVVLDASAAPDSIRVFGFGASMPFAETTRLAVPAGSEPHGEWRFIMIRNTPVQHIVYDGIVQPVRQLPRLAPRRGNGSVDNVTLTECGQCQGRYVVFELPFDSLDVGSYTLRVSHRHGDRIDTLSMQTRIFWRDMPYSLRDQDFAIDAMWHILTREELAAMRDGDAEFRRQKFRKYWQEKDPTPGTAYNELMTEYFRRVDEAYVTFRTLFEENGARTDRGKIYILFGPPEDTQRLLASGEPATEIWYYPSLSKTFRFVDTQRNGNFRLMED
jgi:GWxTD domain-containing protein